MVKQDTRSGTDSAPGAGLVDFLFRRPASHVCRAVSRQVVGCRPTQRTGVSLRVVCSVAVFRLFKKGVL